jgi:thiamine biosynthesis lipoprotein
VKGLILLILLSIATPVSAELIEQSRWVMATELRILIESGDRETAELDPLFEECFDLATGCEHVLSRWDPEAELALLNASAGREVKVSPQLFAWLQRCARDSRLTEGAFDPSVGTWILDPYTNVEIGMDRILRDSSRSTVILPEGMALDSGGDGKGIAVDLIASHLRQAGVGALVSFGGSSWYGVGKGPQSKGWQLAVLDVDGVWIGTAILKNAALSVSHSVQVDELENGRTRTRYHIYDPATGRLVKTKRTSVVWAKTATAAEVLSTALIVRGPAGMKFLKQFPDAEAILTPVRGRTPDWWELPTTKD